MNTRIIDDDIVKVYKYKDGAKTKDLLATLMWGDEVRVIDSTNEFHILDWARQTWTIQPNGKSKPILETCQAVIPADTKFRNDRILKVRFVDVGQGDATIIETPKGKMIIIDGGQNDELVRYMRAAWSYVLRDTSVHADAAIITHGDEDHLKGLIQLLNKPRFNLDGTPTNEPLVKVDRIYHNGLIKRKGIGDDTPELFGEVTQVDQKQYILDLVDDPDALSEDVLADNFKLWKKVLKYQRDNNPEIACNKIGMGDDRAFQFLEEEGVYVKVLGPVFSEINHHKALPWLHKTPGGKAISGSHTINGHSVILRMEFGKIRFLFGADLNEESERMLLEKLAGTQISLQSEILKVPHHGSDDFEPEFFNAISPVVSLISCGDEETAKDYIHPRACLIGALGKYSRASVKRPLIFITELSAFFEKIGFATIFEMQEKKNEYVPRAKNSYFEPRTYKKKTHGILHIRTDGKRVLAATPSAKLANKEAYAFIVKDDGSIKVE